MRCIIFALALMAGPAASAEILVPNRTIRAREIIYAEDLVRTSASIVGALSELSEITGFEARIVLYPGRPIRPGDIGPAAIVNRNDLVALVFSRGLIRISTEGRALGRGAAGDTVRAMNIASHTTVTGEIQADGSIEVQ